MKHFASIFAITVTLLMAGSLRADPIYPDVANTSHATPEVTTFFKSYFTAKSEHKPVPTTDHFSEAHLTYIDATLGWPFYNKKAMIDIFEMYMPKWPSTGLSYSTGSPVIRTRRWSPSPILRNCSAAKSVSLPRSISRTARWCAG
ncbi:MAG: hypothetical protein WAK39_00715 [Pseudolabrys sp.]